MDKRNNIFPRVLALSVILAGLLAYLYVGQMYIASGPSMTPTIYDGERIVVDKKVYDSVPPRRGDVVALISPDRGRYFVKRIVAEAKDEVEVSQSGITVNGEMLSRTEGPWQPQEYTLALDEVYVLGDNRYNSMDSRDFGPIKAKKVIGKVKVVVWPPSSWRIVK
ncbi:hypothetical protein LCGC14_1623380 [marine sediment metagenome]|uniref:signal peptidase I n=1 Tax=marine sediment metagenome TaxID=412755 RepID=A0A0F9L4F4_9ZZZZ